MFSDYIHHLLSQAVYEKDVNGYIVANVPGYQWFFSQWETMEQARENLIDAIEWVLFHKIQHKDKKIIAEINSFIGKNSPVHA
jgi:predicted RNase H-like HicB family nuclease